MHTELNRAEVQRLLRTSPFQKFILSMVGGERIIIEHPENIAFDPTPGGRADFYVLGGQVRYFGTFGAISSIATLDQLFEPNESTGSAAGA